jgi:hypothetical protein
MRSPRGAYFFGKITEERGQGACDPRESSGWKNASTLEEECQQKDFRRLAPEGVAVPQCRSRRRQTKAGS